MTMFAFSKTLFQPTHLKELEMTLFIIYAKCTPIILAAYWAASIDDAYDAAAADGFDPDAILPLQATPEQQALYHGPDFDGRKAYWVIPLDGRESFGVAADDAPDAAFCAFDNVGSSNYAMSPIPMTKEEADARLEPGWDQ